MHLLLIRVVAQVVAVEVGVAARGYTVPEFVSFQVGGPMVGWVEVKVVRVFGVHVGTQDVGLGVV